MEAKELRTRSAAELADELVKLRKEQFALRMQRATGQQPKPDQFGKVRRNIARLKTVLREKQAAAGKRKKSPRSQRPKRRPRRAAATPAGGRQDRGARDRRAGRGLRGGAGAGPTERGRGAQGRAPSPGAW